MGLVTIKLQLKAQSPQPEGGRQQRLQDNSTKPSIFLQMSCELTI